MRGSVFELKSRPGATRWLLAVICAVGALGSAASHADNDRRGRDEWKQRGQHFEQRHDRNPREHRRHGYRDDDRRDRDWQRQDRHRDSRSDWRWEHRDGRRHYYRPDWHFHNGRHWAPPHYRGRYCDDRRHFHGVHYHVAARDYYDYYYPRYSYHGARPFGANASVIISIPLF